MRTMYFFREQKGCDTSTKYHLVTTVQSVEECNLKPVLNVFENSVIVHTPKCEERHQIISRHFVVLLHSTNAVVTKVIKQPKQNPEVRVPKYKFKGKR